MALIQCSECAREISDKAPVCPNCGVPREIEVRDVTDKIRKAQEAQSAHLFVNPQTGQTKDIGGSWLFCLAFGFLFFLAKGLWTHVAISLVIIIVFFSLPPFIFLMWFIYPFFANSIVRNNLISKGWEPLKIKEDAAQP